MDKTFLTLSNVSCDFFAVSYVLILIKKNPSIVKVKLELKPIMV